jgi:predicted nuclease of predicted toxin-antitoxin system
LVVRFPTVIPGPAPDAFGECMRFKVDENLPIEMAQKLRSAGYDAMTVLEQRMGREPDTNLYYVCQEEERVLVTLDLDFSDIRSYPPGESAGIVVLRFARQDKPYVLAQFDRVIPPLTTEAIAGRLWIVDKRQVRIRE